MTTGPLDDDYRMPLNPKPSYCPQCDNEVGEDETLCLECREDAGAVWQDKELYGRTAPRLVYRKTLDARAERSGSDTRTQDINMTQKPTERCLHPERSALRGWTLRKRVWRDMYHPGIYRERDHSKHSKKESK